MRTLLERMREGLPLEGVEIVDMHSHVGRAAFSIPATDAESIVKSMDRLGIDITVTTALCPLRAEDEERANKEVLEASRAYPGRILGYLWAYPKTLPPTEDEVDRRVAAGFVGVKFHNVNGIEYTHEAYEPYLAVADRRRMPVLLHTWGQEDDFKQVRELVKRYPNVSVLLAHSGSCQEDDYVHIAKELENVYLELAVSTSPRGLIERFTQAAGAENLVWGSDVAFINQAQQLGKVVGAKIAEDQKRQILGGNARRILDRVVRGLL